MYHKILMALENSSADRAVVTHVVELAGHFKAEVVLLHVADGWAARNYDQLQLTESDEIKADREYLERVVEEFRVVKIVARARLAMGSPPEEILKAAADEKCDLIAMASHGHRWLADLIFGSTISTVRHRAEVPILLVRHLKK